MHKVFLFFCILFIGGTASAQSQTFEPADFPSLLSSIKIKAPVDFCGEPVPLDDPLVYEELEKEFLLFLWRRSQVILWLKRTGRYMPYIEKMLKKHRIPDDIKYSAVVESSLMPVIRSSKYATGLWQFIKPTGIRYGLTINSEIDERRNVYKATEAAISYLKKLYGEFGSWTLAVAAYNMGEAGLRSQIEFQKTNDYYHLYLPEETERHILKIVAAKLILTKPEAYGFHFQKEDFYKPLEFDTVRAECRGKTSLQLIAEAAGTYYKTIKDLNPEFIQRYLPEGTYSVAVPKGASKIFYDRFKTLSQETSVKSEVKTNPRPKPVSRTRTYVVKRGDTLSRIAAKFNVSVSDIIKWNRLNRRKPIVPGQRLVIRK